MSPNFNNLYQLEKMINQNFFRRYILMLKIAMFLVISLSVDAQNVTVNPGGGSYPTLKDAFDAINLGTHTGALTISIVNNTTETSSAVLNASGTGAANYTSIVLSPSGTQTITGSIVGHLIDFNGANNVMINGNNDLTISNTATGASSTIRFINDASNNTISQTNLQGSGTASFGVITFGTGTVTGNDNNTISNCNIGPAGINLPLNGIFSLGTSATIDNSNNNINSNNISDFFNAGAASNGMNINTGNSAWTIINNKLFQTASRTYTTASTHNGINILSGTGYVITSNTIGYANSTGTGIYMMAGTIATRFVAINLGLTAGSPSSSVQGNTISAISLATSSGATTANGILCGISVVSGNVNIGNISPNTIGGALGTDLLKGTATTTGGLVVGIHIAAPAPASVNIQNNIIGGLSSSGVTASVAGSVAGIVASVIPGTMTINGNTIGNSTLNNLQGGTDGLTTGASLVTGVWLAGTPSTTLSTNVVLTNNTIQNLRASGTGGSSVRGVLTALSSSALATGWIISNNTVNNLSTNGSLTSLSSGVTCAVGIHHLSSQGCTISQNLISNISNTNTTATTNIIVAGIMTANASVTSSLGVEITRNRIWNLSNTTIGTTALTPPIVVGIGIRSGNNVTSITNNMISIGEGQTTNTSFIGI